jgi:hypothetical protein
MKKVKKIQITKPKISHHTIAVPAYAERVVAGFWRFRNDGPGMVDCLEIRPDGMVGVVLWTGKITAFDRRWPVLLRSLDPQGATIAVEFAEDVSHGPPEKPEDF